MRVLGRLQRQEAEGRTGYNDSRRPSYTTDSTRLTIVGDDNPRCKQCERLGGRCRRGRGKLKFRHGSSARYDENFPGTQTWLAQTKNAKFQFVDQGPELENYYSQDDFAVNCARPVEEEQRPGTASFEPYTSLDSSVDAGLSPTVHSGQSSDVPPFLSPATSNIETVLSSGAEQWQQGVYDPVRGSNSTHTYRIYTTTPKTYSPVAINGINSMDEGRHVPKVVEAEYRRLADSAAAIIPDDSLLSPAVWKEDFYWPNIYTTTQCACLMRYYIDQLAGWFDVGDPGQHFALTVPQRARRCPPLLNAIFTAASRHLVNNADYKSADGLVKYNNVPLPKLTPETAVKYHNACIAYLIKLSNDPEYVRDENLLAATVILRYYEEIDTTFMSSDSETFLRPFQVFVNAQSSPYSHILGTGQNPEYLRPGMAAGIYENMMSYLRSFQHAVFRNALRQEITTSFLRQRPIRLPLEHWTILQGFDEVEDFVWADRHLFHCAKVMQYCFEDSVTLPHMAQVERWNTLKHFETQWEQVKPLSFAPIHYQEPDRSKGECFPHIWHMAEIHVTGLLYLELAKILLTAFNPNRPRLGHGSSTAEKRFVSDSRESLIRICGMAMSNPLSKPALVQAYMAVAVCGGHVTDPVEQKALLKVIDRLNQDHGWPIAKTVFELKKEWGWLPKEE
ncbi:hypothetical protein LTS17_000369 [Exophiala oligosperma]